MGESCAGLKLPLKVPFALMRRFASDCRPCDPLLDFPADLGAFAYLSALRQAEAEHQDHSFARERYRHTLEAGRS